MEYIKFQCVFEFWGEGFMFQDKICWDDFIDYVVNGGFGVFEVLY